MDRELVVLGTASQTPTRYRNHNGYLLRWDGHHILFDPGEGTQRQLLMAGFSGADIHRICLTHFHGDHCLGLPGVLARMHLDQVTGPVPIHHHVAGTDQLHHLEHAAPPAEPITVVHHPVEGTGERASTVAGSLTAHRLDHGEVPTVGWRLEEPDGRRLLPEQLDRAGIQGADRSQLVRDGSIQIDGRTIDVDEVSVPWHGQRFAFVMDTRPCEGALHAAADADLLVCESTFLESERDLANDYAHMTAGDAARLAVEAGARTLVLTHYSQRHPDEADFLREAERVAKGRVDVVAATDLARIPVPDRR